MLLLWGNWLNSIFTWFIPSVIKYRDIFGSIIGIGCDSVICFNHAFIFSGGDGQGVGPSWVLYFGCDCCCPTGGDFMRCGMKELTYLYFCSYNFAY